MVLYLITCACGKKVITALTESLSIYGYETSVYPSVSGALASGALPIVVFRARRTVGPLAIVVLNTTVRSGGISFLLRLSRPLTRASHYSGFHQGDHTISILYSL